MLFDFLRIIFWSAGSLAIILIIPKKVKKKSVCFLFLISYMLLISLTGVFPIENIFIEFKSPESVFHYARNGKVDDIIFGKNSCMISYSKGSSKGGFYIIPKTEKGYKIPSYFATKKVSHKFDRNGNFDVYQVVGTTDYYIYGTFISKDREITVVDSDNKTVDTSIVEMDNQDTKTIYLYTYVEDFTEEYFLMINCEKIFISDAVSGQF